MHLCATLMFLLPTLTIEDQGSAQGRQWRTQSLVLQVPDLHQAYIFYCDGLGFTQDPGTWSKQRGGFKVLWFNLGRHQVTPCCKMGPPCTDAVL